MERDQQALLESAPAGAVPSPSLSALAQRLRSLETAMAKSSARAKQQEERLRGLRQNVDEFSGKFEILKQRVEEAANAVPAFEPPAPALEALPATIVQPAARTAAVSVEPAPAKSRRMRVAGLWPYALLTGFALALCPSISIQTGTPVEANALVRVAPPPAPQRDEQAIALALSFRPAGSERTFGQLLGPQLDTAGPSAWETQSVGSGVFLVSFRPHDVMGPQADYEFTVDVKAGTVTPEPDTAGRLFAGL